MTLQEILDDIRSDRVKKVIMDCDAYNDIDDQYAIALALGSDKIDVLSVNATLFDNYRCNGYEDGMERSYNEIVKILKLLNCEHIPAYKGCTRPFNEDDAEDAWIDSPAVQNIIKTAREADELIYVIATGAATNVVSALKADRSIRDKICVMWLGANAYEYDGGAAEFNVGQDFIACRYLLNCGVNLVHVPCMAPEGCGSQTLIADQDNIKAIKGDNERAKFFREDLPELSYPGEKIWFHHLWDVAVPGILHAPELYDLKIVMPPRMRGDYVWSFEPDRHNVIYMYKLDYKEVMKEFYGVLNKLIEA